MRPFDAAKFAMGAARSQTQRTAVTALGVAVGVAAVTWLAAIGFGVRKSALSEFAQFGSEVLSVTPGRTQTFGVSGSMLNSVRPLLVDDARAIARLPEVVCVAPVVAGNAEVKHRGRTRRTEVHGIGSAMPRVWEFAIAEGSFALDDGDDARANAVLGATVARELFPMGSAVGALVRIGSERYRVVGVMAAKGQFLGIDLDDAAYVPTARGLSLFHRDGLMQIAVKFAPTADAAAVAQRVRDVLTARHGRLDVTVREQRQMLDVLDDALTAIALGAVAIGLLALVTGSLGVAAITAVAVRERTGEVGLLRAIGATRRAIAAVFVIEAAGIGAIGGIAGVILGLGLAGLVQVAWPDLPMAADPLWSLLALVFAAGIGAIAGAWPAFRAAKLDPADALRAE